MRHNMALPLLTGLVDQHGETLQQAGAALLVYLKQGEDSQPFLMCTDEDPRYG